MDIHITFSGFPQSGLDFLSDLAAHNERTWFEAHKEEYQKTLIEPAQAFVVALGDEIAVDFERHSLRYAHRWKRRVDAYSP